MVKLQEISLANIITGVVENRIMQVMRILPLQNGAEEAVGMIYLEHGLIPILLNSELGQIPKMQHSLNFTQLTQ